MRNGLMNLDDRKVRRYVPSNVEARRFGQGAEVQYKGAKHTALKDKMGVIDSYVEGEKNLVSVTFPEMPPEDRYYLLSDEVLDTWRGKPKIERVEKDDKKEVKVEKRKGVAKGKRNKGEE